MKARALIATAIWVTVTAISVTTVSTAAADVVLREKYPTRGVSTELFIQDDAGAPVSSASVSVTYRPGSSVEAVESIGVTGPSGRIVWNPSTAGIAELLAEWDGGSSNANVSVKFASPPVGGILIMIFAGLLLIAGSAVQITRMLKSQT